jgi:hypothetical protein
VGDEKMGSYIYRHAVNPDEVYSSVVFRGFATVTVATNIESVFASLEHDQNVKSTVGTDRGRLPVAESSR